MAEPYVCSSLHCTYILVFTVWSRTIKSEIPPMIELIEVRAETLYTTWQNKIQKEPDWGHRIRWKNHIQGPEQVEEPYSGHVIRWKNHFQGPEQVEEPYSGHVIRWKKPFEVYNPTQIKIRVKELHSRFWTRGKNYNLFRSFTIQIIQ